MRFETIDQAVKAAGNKDNKQFYSGLSYNKNDIETIFDRPNHAHTEALADLIEADMENYGLSDAQKENLERLREGKKVVIGGQQAGLFMSPSYIIHKIISLLIVTNELNTVHNKEAVPVFWVAGEDHDFEEVNHTFVYDSYYRRRVKVSYKPNLSVPMSVGFYEYDKDAMKESLNKLVAYLGDSTYVNKLKEAVNHKIDRCTSWTELFHSLVHETFKSHGLIIFNSHLKAVRELEKPILKKMFKNHEAIDLAFKDGQKKYNETMNTTPVIDTDTTVHLFGNADTERELFLYKDGSYHLGGKTYSQDEVLALIEERPESFSNNVVTRPLMQEALFNTAVFLGGGAEVKYWGEIHKTFEVMDVQMPIVLKRMEFVYQDERIQKLLNKYELNFDDALVQNINELKRTLIDNHTDEALIKEVDHIKETIDNAFEALYKKKDEYFNSQLIDSNKKQHQLQLDYLKNRYNIEIKRALRQDIHNLEELSEKLFPNGVLQERIYHPWQLSAELWDYSPLSYTENLVIIKK